MKREINIRLNANRAKVVNTGQKLVSGDKGIVFKIAVDELDTTGTTAKIAFKRSNGTSVESNITATENVYSYTTLGNELEVVGPVVADVKFYEGENRISTSTFIFEVVSDTMDGIGAGTAGYSDTLEQMKESMLQAQEGMNATKGEMETLSSQLETLYDSYAEAFGTTGAFNPKGNYSAEESYTVRDLVTYNGGTWICTKNCTGATPGPDSDCWQYFFSHAEIEAIITGTQQVGNAKTLDGHGAEYFAKAAELLNYLSKSGGTLNGHLFFDHNQSIFFKDENGNERLGIFANFYDREMGIYSYIHGAVILSIPLDGSTPILHGTATGNLPLNNGSTIPTVATGQDTVMRLNSTNGNNSAKVCFSENDTVLGDLGFDGVDNPVFYTANGLPKNLLHTGNKPTGSYTGNGSATQRYINTGGIGDSILIQGNGYETIVTKGTGSGGNKTLYNGFGDGEVYFANGTCELNTDHEALNANGVTYTYRVL